MFFFFFPAAALAAAFTLASCSSDDDAMQGGTQSQAKQRAEIAFATASSTRGGAEAAQLTDFKAWGFMPDGTQLFSNLTYKWDSDDQTFRSNPAYYWPKGTHLDFYALQPTAIAGSTTYTPTVTASVKHLEVAQWPGVEDVIAAVAKAEEEPVKATPLTFKHVLSQISVNAQVASTGQFTCRLKSIKMITCCNGTYTFGTTTGSAGSWDTEAVTKDYPYAEGIGSGIDIAPGQNAVGQHAALGNLFWNVLPASPTFEVEYQVLSNGQVILDYTGSNKKTVTDNTPVTMGNKYVYMFTLNSNPDPLPEIKFTKTVTGYIAGGTVEKPI